MRAIFWAASTEVVLIIFTSLSGISLPVLSANWAFTYLVIPGFIGWLCGNAKPEGRPLHTAIWAWIAILFTGHHSIGGFTSMKHTQHMKGAKVKVSRNYVPRKPFPVANVLGGGFAVGMSLFLLLHFVGLPNPGSPHDVPRPAQAARSMPPLAWSVLPTSAAMRPFQGWQP